MPDIKVPETAEGLQEVLTTPANMKELLKDPTNFAKFVTDHVNLRLKADPQVMDQVKEQTEAVMIDWLREHGMENLNRLNLSHNGTPANQQPKLATIYNKAALGAKHDKAFENFTEMLYSISGHAYKDGDLSRKLGELKNDLSSVKPSDGGFLIPEVLRAELLQAALETAIVRSRATVIPMDSLKVAIPTVDSTSNVSSVFGGIVGYWTEEGATLTESQPRFGRVDLEAHKLTLYTEVPNELIADARPAMNALLGQMFPKALAWFEDVAFFVGGGVGEPLGFLNAPAMVTVARTGDVIDWPHVVNMYARMLPQSLNNAVWIASPDALPELFQMTVNVQNVAGTENVGGSAVYISNGVGSPPMTLLGRPLIVSEKAKPLGTAGDLTFVDLSYYLLGDRQAMSVRQSEEFRFQNDLTAFRVIERIDGRPWLQSAITPQNNSANTLSAFVTAAT